jgi:hypothetical protein
MLVFWGLHYCKRWDTHGTLRKTCGTGPAITVAKKAASSHSIGKTVIGKTIAAINEVKTFNEDARLTMNERSNDYIDRNEGCKGLKEKDQRRPED